MSENKKSKIIIFTVIIILLFASGLGIFVLNKKPIHEQKTISQPDKSIQSEDEQPLSPSEPETPDTKNIINNLPKKNLKGITTSPLFDNQYKIIIRFGFDKDQPDSKTHDHFVEVLNIISNNQELISEISIEGHTDSIGPTVYNDGLSKRRVKTAYDIIKSPIDIIDGQVNQAYYGENKPVSDNRTSQGRAENRRAEIIFSYQ